ncbi:unnamed protein product [Brassica napus]|uniref:(rape) hypothetical protein n=1 Tax=Brassica napus TaxID=3708 RepID=A0A816QAP7_BRANA|nr:unnamed protein product [Brassica napus]
MLFDSGSGGGPDLIVDDGGDATQVVILCETVSKPTPIVTGENPLQVNHLPTVKPVWWRWLLEGGGGGLCHGGGCRGDGCRSGGCGYVCGRREGGIVVVEVAIREEEVVVNTVEVKYVRSW